MKNPYPEQKRTHERQVGGHTPAEGEKHNQPKAKTIPEARRYSGAEETVLDNSPGRGSSDVSGK